MYSTAANLLATLAVLINTALMLPCACCLGASPFSDECCAVHEQSATPQTTPQEPACCAHKCCSTRALEPAQPETLKPVMSCHEHGSSDICCCNDATVTVAAPVVTLNLSDVFGVELDLSFLFVPSLLSLTSFSPGSSLSQFERSIVSTRSPCALCQLFCTWSK